MQGVGDHRTPPSGRKFTQPSNMQLLFSQDGQHWPGGVTGLAQRGRAHRTALQSNGVVVIAVGGGFVSVCAVAWNQQRERTASSVSCMTCITMAVLGKGFGAVIALLKLVLDCVAPRGEKVQSSKFKPAAHA